jgi:hypothetical protein
MVVGDSTVVDSVGYCDDNIPYSDNGEDVHQIGANKRPKPDNGRE